MNLNLNLCMPNNNNTNTNRDQTLTNDKKQPSTTKETKMNSQEGSTEILNPGKAFAEIKGARKDYHSVATSKEAITGQSTKGASHVMPRSRIQSRSKN